MGPLRRVRPPRLRLTVSVPAGVIFAGAISAVGGGARSGSSAAAPPPACASTLNGGVAAASPPRWEPVAIADLTVTSGRIDTAGGALALRTPTIRALVGTAPRRAIEASFVYRGPTEETAPLASGEPRRQFGLKLRARDTCNVVYVMWHVAPTVGIHVSVKSNPEVRGHADCGDRGYVNLVPTCSRPDLRPISVGARRTLTATLAGDELAVLADGALVWNGKLPTSALAFDGPVGIRTDNGVFDVVVRVGAPPARPEPPLRP